MELEGAGPKLLDADTLIDEILAKKGPQEYKGGLSEDNWEQVNNIALIVLYFDKHVGIYIITAPPILKHHLSLLVIQTHNHVLHPQILLQGGTVGVDRMASHTPSLQLN